MNDLSILVSTYDKNSSLWKPLEKSYNLFWKDLNYPIYITSNHKDYKSKRFNFLKVGDEISWSDNISKCLKKIDTKYVMFCFDDTFWKKNIDNQLFVRLFNQCYKKNWEYLRLHPTPRSTNTIDQDFSLIAKGSKYRASVAFAVFRKDVLEDLLRKEESAWDFEKNASVRSNIYNEFYQINYELFPYHNLLIKSELEPFARKKIVNQGIDLSEISLDSMNTVLAIRFFIYKKLYNFISFMKYKINVS